MNKILYNSLFLGIGTAVVAIASYAVMPPEKPKSEVIISELEIPAFHSKPTTLAIKNPVLGNLDKPVFDKLTANKIEKPTIVAVNTSEDINFNKSASLVHQVKKGENLSSIFYDLDLSKTELHNIIHANELGKQFASISPGKKLYFITNASGQLQELIYHKNSIDTLKATRVDDGFDVDLISKPIEKRVASTQATINSSLFLDGKDAGLSDKLIMQLAEIFAWDIDFALSLRQGDQFTVVYEKIFVEGEEIDTGDIIAAEFVNQNHPFTAVKFEDGEGNISYFTPDGKSMRKAFLRTPVNYARISSHFNLKRKHPVLNRIRAHKGVDYAAKTGTAIKTTGDGKIVFRGRKGGYGRVVIVKHGQKYSTLYAHMSSYKKGQKTGNHIKQGQIIGYVGKSGLATGPHLHYEFRVNGVHRNPLTVKLPHAKPIKKSLLAEFRKQTQPLIAQLNKAKSNTLLAQN